ncbi:hypothetical protein C922_00819 [Plasmodium inui San Antonio 1]|uniref:Cyclin n=1 Tax=Plasmodium inui San Antonio 1 TaxID=1237626 RepID=W7A7I3_9APIC|nr:hypothetical protein C922_00819 [Plasmodium inui San Antonio 1]EUD69127.1 hypothetical protein C922_00819 [Plasmodium inui San Antonio 1]
MLHDDSNGKPEGDCLPIMTHSSVERDGASLETHYLCEAATKAEMTEKKQIVIRRKWMLKVPKRCVHKNRRLVWKKRKKYFPIKWSQRKVLYSDQCDGEVARTTLRESNDQTCEVGGDKNAVEFYGAYETGWSRPCVVYSLRKGTSHFDREATRLVFSPRECEAQVKRSANNRIGSADSATSTALGGRRCAIMRWKKHPYSCHIRTWKKHPYSCLIRRWKKHPYTLLIRRWRGGDSTFCILAKISRGQMTLSLSVRIISPLEVLHRHHDDDDVLPFFHYERRMTSRSSSGAGDKPYEGMHLVREKQINKTDKRKKEKIRKRKGKRRSHFSAGKSHLSKAYVILCATHRAGVCHPPGREASRRGLAAVAAGEKSEGQQVEGLEAQQVREAQEGLEALQGVDLVTFPTICAIPTAVPTAQVKRAEPCQDKPRPEGTPLDDRRNHGNRSNRSNRRGRIKRKITVTRYIVQFACPCSSRLSKQSTKEASFCVERRSCLLGMSAIRINIQSNDAGIDSREKSEFPFRSLQLVGVPSSWDVPFHRCDADGGSKDTGPICTSFTRTLFDLLRRNDEGEDYCICLNLLLHPFVLSAYKTEAVNRIDNTLSRCSDCCMNPHNICLLLTDEEEGSLRLDKGPRNRKQEKYHPLSHRMSGCTTRPALCLITGKEEIQHISPNVLINTKHCDKNRLTAHRNTPVPFRGYEIPSHYTAKNENKVAAEPLQCENKFYNSEHQMCKMWVVKRGAHLFYFPPTGWGSAPTSSEGGGDNADEEARETRNWCGKYASTKMNEVAHADYRFAGSHKNTYTVKHCHGKPPNRMAKRQQGKEKKEKQRDDDGANPQKRPTQQGSKLNHTYKNISEQKHGHEIKLCEEENTVVAIRESCTNERNTMKCPAAVVAMQIDKKNLPNGYYCKKRAFQMKRSNCCYDTNYAGEYTNEGSFAPLEEEADRIRHTREDANHEASPSTGGSNQLCDEVYRGEFILRNGNHSNVLNRLTNSLKPSDGVGCAPPPVTHHREGHNMGCPSEQTHVVRRGTTYHREENKKRHTPTWSDPHRSPLNEHPHKKKKKLSHFFTQNGEDRAEESSLVGGDSPNGFVPTYGEGKDHVVIPSNYTQTDHLRNVNPIRGVSMTPTPPFDDSSLDEPNLSAASPVEGAIEEASELARGTPARKPCFDESSSDEDSLIGENFPCGAVHWMGNRRKRCIHLPKGYAYPSSVFPDRSSGFTYPSNVWGAYRMEVELSGGGTANGKGAVERCDIQMDNQRDNQRDNGSDVTAASDVREGDIIRKKLPNCKPVDEENLSPLGGEHLQKDVSAKGGGRKKNKVDIQRGSILSEELPQECLDNMLQTNRDIALGGDGIDSGSGPGSDNDSDSSSHSVTANSNDSRNGAAAQGNEDENVDLEVAVMERHSSILVNRGIRTKKCVDYSLYNTYAKSSFLQCAEQADNHFIGNYLDRYNDENFQHLRQKVKLCLSRTFANLKTTSETCVLHFTNLIFDLYISRFNSKNEIIESIINDIVTEEKQFSDVMIQLLKEFYPKVYSDFVFKEQLKGKYNILYKELKDSCDLIYHFIAIICLFISQKYYNYRLISIDLIAKTYCKSHLEGLRKVYSRNNELIKDASPDYYSATQYLDSTFSAHSVNKNFALEVEICILKKLNYDLSIPTPYSLLDSLLKANENINFLKLKNDYNATEGEILLRIASIDNIFLKYKSSTLSMAIYEILNFNICKDKMQKELFHFTNFRDDFCFSPTPPPRGGGALHSFEVAKLDNLCDAANHANPADTAGSANDGNLGDCRRRPLPHSEAAEKKKKNELKLLKRQARSLVIAEEEDRFITASNYIRQKALLYQYVRRTLIGVCSVIKKKIPRYYYDSDLDRTDRLKGYIRSFHNGKRAYLDRLRAKRGAAKGGAAMEGAAVSGAKTDPSNDEAPESATTSATTAITTTPAESSSPPSSKKRKRAEVVGLTAADGERKDKDKFEGAKSKIKRKIKKKIKKLNELRWEDIPIQYCTPYVLQGEEIKIYIKKDDEEVGDGDGSGAHNGGTGRKISISGTKGASRKNSDTQRKNKKNYIIGTRTNSTDEHLVFYYNYLSKLRSRLIQGLKYLLRRIKRIKSRQVCVSLVNLSYLLNKKGLRKKRKKEKKKKNIPLYKQLTNEIKIFFMWLYKLTNIEIRPLIRFADLKYIASIKCYERSYARYVARVLGGGAKREGGSGEGGEAKGRNREADKRGENKRDGNGRHGNERYGNKPGSTKRGSSKHGRRRSTLEKKYAQEVSQFAETENKKFYPYLKRSSSMADLTGGHCTGKINKKGVAGKNGKETKSKCSQKEGLGDEEGGDQADCNPANELDMQNTLDDFLLLKKEYESLEKEKPFVEEQVEDDNTGQVFSMPHQDNATRISSDWITINDPQVDECAKELMECFLKWKNKNYISKNWTFNEYPNCKEYYFSLVFGDLKSSETMKGIIEMMHMKYNHLLNIYKEINVQPDCMEYD